MRCCSAPTSGRGTTGPTADPGGGSGGRAQPGEVLIQTRHPDHPIIAAVLDNDWTTLSEQLLAARRQQGLPPRRPRRPALRQPGCQCGSAVPAAACRAARCCPGQGRSAYCRSLAAPMARRAGLYRSHLIVAGRSRGTVQAAMKDLWRQPGSNGRPPACAGLSTLIRANPYDGIGQAALSKSSRLGDNPAPDGLQGS